MRALGAIVVLVGVSGCLIGPPSAVVCTDDSQCSDGQICFPDGCGDPGKNLVVEVTANTRSGQHEQDFAIADGSLKPTYDIQLQTPMLLQGEVERAPSANSTTGPQLYLDPFTVRATGESVVIPGVTRSFQQTFTTPERGAFSMPIAAGKYTVTTTAADPSIPPVVKPAVTIENGGKAFVQDTFVALDAPLMIQGNLVKYLEQAVPPTLIPLTQATMELQAFDPATKRPLSQRAYPSSGLTGSSGVFQLFIDPAAKLLSSIQIVARPREAAAMVPTKTFVLSKPYPVGQTILEMGDFGVPLTRVKGAVVGTDGTPVGGASVYLEGPVSGGGIFRSLPTTTDPDTGEFIVDVLPSPYETSYTITVLPLSKSGAGVLTAQTRAVGKPGADPVLEPNRFVCPDKLGVVGTVNRPDSKGPAAMVLITATPVKAVSGLTLPTEATEVVTDDSGRFSFNLDPAVYRFDFSPGEDQPRIARYVTIAAPAGGDAGTASATLDLGQFTLSKGRKVTGNIFWNSNAGVLPINAINATVRFFRLTTIDGKPGATLLGEAVTDASGVYGVVLPGSPE